ncbi:MAG: pyridoxamine 5'-phosphate oxidase family protein, partial [Tepidiformaceae bacterium]
VSFATVNSKCEPIVSPLDGWFIHGQFIVSTGGTALRAQHIRRNAAVSLAHVVGDDIGIWVHGRARFAERGEALTDEYDRIATATYCSSPFGWGDVAILPIEARAMFAYAPDPTKYEG